MIEQLDDRRNAGEAAPGKALYWPGHANRG